MEHFGQWSMGDNKVGAPGAWTGAGGWPPLPPGPPSGLSAWDSPGGRLALRGRGTAGWGGMLVSKLPRHRVTLRCLHLKVLGFQSLFFQRLGFLPRLGVERGRSEQVWVRSN